MIDTHAYISSRSDTLATLFNGFSAIDERLYAEMTEEERTVHGKRILARLGALTLIHGQHALVNLKAALETCSGESLFAAVCRILEIGYDDSRPSNRELQQELLHFSRICDAGVCVPSASPLLKRLNRSAHIPGSLKFLIELAIVIRSRVATYSRLPHFYSAGRVLCSEYGNLSRCETQDVQCCVLIGANNSRRRRRMAYLFRQILDHLPPYEALLCLAAYQIERRADRVGILLIDPVNTRGRLTHWELKPNSHQYTTVADVLQMLPHCLKSTTRSTVFRLHEDDVFVTDNGDSISYNLPNEQSRSVSVSAATTDYPTTISPQAVIRACSEMTRYDLASIEAGHIHLNRGLDVDQEIGIWIAREYFRMMKGAAGRQRPKLFPMVDDDHVLIVLPPKEFSVFFSEQIGGEPYSLIPESSPIIRAIVVALFRRIRIDLASNLFERGGNLYLRLSDDLVCELFEDISGKCDTGCIFFEIALLVYRSYSMEFDDLFRDYAGKGVNVHDVACEILSRDTHHDQKVSDLKRWYSQFTSLTCLSDHPTCVDSALERMIYSETKRVLVHVNILESYYESQQDKVRSFLNILNLPIRLVSVHFSRTSVYVRP